MTDYTSSRGLAQEPVVGEFEKLPSGARYADLKCGTGAATVQRGSRVSLQWVLRRSNGYFVDSSQTKDNNFDPFVFTVRLLHVNLLELR